MTQALERIDVPLKRPPGVTPKQWRLAVLFPRAESAYQALIQAGYTPSTALGKAKRATESVGVERATEAIAAAKRDSARQIKQIAGAGVLTAVSSKNADPNYALSAWATASKIAAEYPDQEEGVGNAEREAAKAYIRRVVRGAIAALVATGALHNSADAPALSDEVIDSIALAAESSELTECTLPDVTPQASTKALPESKKRKRRQP